MLRHPLLGLVLSLVLISCHKASSAPAALTSQRPVAAVMDLALTRSPRGLPYFDLSWESLAIEGAASFVVYRSSEPLTSETAQRHSFRQTNAVTKTVEVELRANTGLEVFHVGMVDAAKNLIGFSTPLYFDTMQRLAVHLWAPEGSAVWVHSDGGPTSKIFNSSTGSMQWLADNRSLLVEDAGRPRVIRTGKTGKHPESSPALPHWLVRHGNAIVSPTGKTAVYTLPDGSPGLCVISLNGTITVVDTGEIYACHWYARGDSLTYRKVRNQPPAIAQSDIHLADGEFSFVGGQKRLRSLIIIDLKIRELSHADVGQMNMYLNYAREHWSVEGENPPVGLILCSPKGQQLARYALQGIQNTVLASEYRMQLPATELLEEELRKSLTAFEGRGNLGTLPS